MAGKVATFRIPGQITFGAGAAETIGMEAKRLGATHAVVLSDPNLQKLGVTDRIVASLSTQGVRSTVYAEIEFEPSIQSVAPASAAAAKASGCDLVIGLGGGSVMDSTKVLAAAYKGKGVVWDYLTQKATVTKDTLPIIQVPTMAGTGSEVNAGAVISNWETHEKFAVVNSFLFAKVAVIDPQITITVPVKQIRAGGADIFCHVAEPYITDTNSSQLTDGIREATMRAVVENLPLALENPKDINVRTKLSWASTLAMSNLMSLGGGGGVFSLHAIEHAVSGYFDVTHAEGLASLMPAWMKFNLPACKQRIDSLGKNVFGKTDGVAAVEEWLSKIGLKVKLGQLGASLDKAKDVGIKAVMGGFGMKDNPIPLDADLVAQIYRNAF